MSITLKVALTVVSSLALAMALVVGLNLLRFDGTQRAIDTERAAILLLDLSYGVTAAHDVGVPLGDFAPLAELREHARRKGDDLLDLLLFDHDGRVLQSGEPALEGSRVPDAWLAAQALAGEDVWSLAPSDRLIVGLGFRTSFGERAGGLVAVLSRRQQQADLTAMLNHLGLTALAIFALAALLAIPASLLLSQRLRRLVGRIDASIAGIPGDGGGREAAALRPLLDGFAERRREAEAALAVAEGSPPGGEAPESRR